MRLFCCSRRHLIITASFAVLLITAALFIPAAAEGTVFRDYMIPAEETEELLQGLEETLDMPDLKLDCVPVIYDKTTNTCYYSSSGSGFTRAEVDLPDGRLLIPGNQDMNSPIDIILITGNLYLRTKLVVTPLPIINIFLPNEEVYEDYYGMNFRLYDSTGGKTTITDSPGEIKLRGRSSLQYPKQPFRITLLKSDGEHRKVQLLDMRKDDDWILYAAYNDHEKIRNVFSSNLWYDSCARNNPYNVTAGMEYRYVELFINNQYWGLYALGYPIDEKQFSKGTIPCIALFEKRYQEISETNVELNDDLLPGYELRNDIEDEDPYWAALRRIFHTADISGDPEEVWKCINRDNAIDIFLFLNLIQGVDNCSNNCNRNLYVAIMKNEQLLYAPWDMDQSFGASWDGSVQNKTSFYSISPDQNVIMTMNPVWRFLENEEVKTAVKERYATLRQGPWSEESLLELIDHYEQQIFFSGAYDRDRERWPDGSYLEGSSSLDLFRTYVIQRLSFMDAYIGGL